MTWLSLGYEKLFVELSAKILIFDVGTKLVVVAQETFVELHLLTGAGKLQQQGIKTDFHADIRDAKVFGTPRTSDIDGPASNNRVDATSPQPPDILALTLDSGHLAFVYAQSCSEQGQVKFIVSKQRIDSRGIHPTHLGKSIAVDPRYLP